MRIFYFFLKIYLKAFYKKAKNQSVDKVLILSNTAIGDTLFSTPLFRECKKAFPEARFTAVLNPSNFKLFETNPHIDGVLLYDGRWRGFWKTVQELKKRAFDIAIISHSNEPQASPLCALAGIRTIIKVPNLKNDWNFLHFNPPTPMIEDDYTVLNRLKSLEFLGAKSHETRLELFLKDGWIEKAKSFLKDFEGRKKVGFQIGASTLSRQWFDDRWVALGKAVLAKYPDAVIVFTGAPNEKQKIEKIAVALPKEKVLVAAGALSLEEGAALIGELDLFVTPDTGPLHIAVALQTSTVSLFAVANPACSLPNYDKALHDFIKVPKTCAPCIGKRCRYQECMEQISVNAVLQKLKQKYA